MTRLHYGLTAIGVIALANACAPAPEAPAVAVPIEDLPELTCPAVNDDALSPDQKRMWRAAYAQACATFGSDDFRRRVAARNYRTHCTVFGRRDVTGVEVLQSLSSIGEFHIATAERLQTRSTTASADIVNMRITVRNSRLAVWDSDNREDKARLVDTIIHEMTHLVPMANNPGRPRFRDSGQWLPTCNRGRLVSYAIGEIASSVWLGAR